MSKTYASYLRLDQLLSSVQPVSDGPEHDETLFIIVHQVYELWFKQMLHEGDHLIAALGRADVATIMATLKRMLTILKTLVVQIDVLETMTPLSFLTFRDRLDSSSGFQSVQFREIEAFLGKRNRATIEHFPPGPERARVERRLAAPGLWEAFLGFLSHLGHPIAKERLDARPAEPEESPDIQEVLLHIYRSDPITSQICERLVDLDEGVQEWRYRHMKMVERTIGTKAGTGGSAGVGYLKTTLFQAAFPDLWAIRRHL